MRLWNWTRPDQLMQGVMKKPSRFQSKPAASALVSALVSALASIVKSSLVGASRAEGVGEGKSINGKSVNHCEKEEEEEDKKEDEKN